jgi:hypothetical protein
LRRNLLLLRRGLRLGGGRLLDRLRLLLLLLLFAHPRWDALSGLLRHHGHRYREQQQAGL